jgi:membrane-associated phospholipid phosphatase
MVVKDDTASPVTENRHAADAPAALRGLRTTGTLALVALVALVAFLPRLVAIDEAVWRAVLLGRGCTSDVAIARIVDAATRTLLVLVVAAAFVYARRHGLRSVWPWTATAGLGLLAGKTMKHLLTRDRPSSLPDVLLGYSFPSAHAMNGIVALLAVIAFTRDLHGRRWWRTAAAALSVSMIAGRLLLGRHWVCDVVGGVLMALALGGVVVPVVERRPLVAPAVVGAALLAVFGVDRSAANRGFRLPTPLVGRATTLLDVDVGADRDLGLTGAWREREDEPPGGSLVWLEGAGSIPIEVPTSVVDAPLRIAFAGRPALPFAGCATVSVDLNGRAVAQFVPFSGWREYRVPIAAGLMHAGRNQIALDVRAANRPWRFAVAYVRVAAGSAAE